MLGINRKKIWQGSDSKPEPNPWEPCCPTPTAVIYFWIKRVGSFGQIKKKKNDPTEWIIFFCIYSYTAKNNKKTTKDKQLSKTLILSLKTLSDKPFGAIKQPKNSKNHFNSNCIQFLV